MNLEQIDTSTTAGKAEVMRLAAEGRKVAIGPFRSTPMAELKNEPSWDWTANTYGIIAEPVGMEEVWVVVGLADGQFSKQGADELAAEHPGTEVVRYIRADLAENREPSIPASVLRSLADRWASDRCYEGSPVDDVRALVDQPAADLAGEGA